MPLRFKSTGFFCRLSSNCLDDSLDDEIGEFSDIEEEVEIQPTKSLLSGPTLLSPGENVVIVKAKVCFKENHNYSMLKE